MSERFLRTEMLLGSEAIAKLSKSKVAVFGLGGVGSWCAEGLCRSGIGEITLIDQDSVGESNINRQLVATYSSLGKSKAETMASRLLDINPEVKVSPITARYDADTRDQFLETSYDYIVDCIDLVSCKLDLIETALSRNIPIISALGAGNKMNAEALQITDISKTKNCPLARVVRKELHKRGINHLPVVYSNELAMKPEDAEEPPPGRRSVPGSLVWVTATAGMLLCSHVVMTLAKQTAPSI
ncbi:MAG: tRNA threonylcarbamoyladenosine dehydratase [Firmicutes bacterium HGW-Firmicutes-16]|nr:MAG: tRNA threonylcarbamoyladenosine dehydratase [Firmicutes bacterium HGW-Firmicutes-16]